MTMKDDTMGSAPIVEPEEIEAEGDTALVEQEEPATTAKLIVKRNGAETDESFPVNSPATIGRFDASVGPVDIDLGNLPEGAYVSRKHARFTLEDGVWTIEDLGSSNGTFILRDDFERVEAAELSDGTEIALGNARFIFKLS